MRFSSWFQLSLLLALLALSACAPEVERVTAPTQVLLSIQFSPELRGRSDALRASLFVEQASGFQPRKSLTITTAGRPWPIELPILPRASDRADARFEVIVEALSREQVVAATRVLSRFLPNQHGVITTSLATCRAELPSFVCADASCHGDECQVCGAGGGCVRVLPITPSIAGASSPGGEADAATTTRDGGAPASESGERDAGSTPPSPPLAAPVVDASMVMSPVPPSDAATPAPGEVCAAGDLCPRDYPCVPTALGYTCRGLFADWPMPDSSKGAKHAPHYSSDGVTVVDTITHLEWQIGMPKSLPGCSEYSRPSSGGVGPVGEFCKLLEARRYCDQLELGGKSDWRLPTMIELVTLIDHTVSLGHMAINRDFLGEPEWSGFVSTSLYAHAPANYRQVDYFDRATYQGMAGLVRCVRAGGEPPFAKPSERYRIDDAAGTVTDQATTLVWQRRASSAPLTREQVALASGCPAGFRLPTPNELATLIDLTKQKPAIDGQAFPDTPSALFWSALHPDDHFGVSFEYGDLRRGVSEAYVRCVK